MVTRKKTTGKKVGGRKNTAVKSTARTTTKPTLPYATAPGALRKFLEQIPKRPKPEGVDGATIRSWGLADSNASTITRVLKAVGLLNAAGSPTDDYVEFMKIGTGPAVLAGKICETYAALFSQSHAPHQESQETLRNLFNIHSGGSERTVEHQIQTFKALCDYADFNANSPRPPGSSPGLPPPLPGQAGATPPVGQPYIHIDLHIHLPENKARRDYEYMFEDIARYIFGRGNGGPSGTGK